MEEHEEYKNELSLTPFETLEGEIIEIKEPAAPKGVSDDEITALKVQAKDLVEELNTATGSKEMALIDDMSNVGLRTQRTAGSELDLLRVRMGEMMVRKDTSTEISHDLVDLRLALNEINPHKFTRPSLIRRVVAAIPVVNRFFSPMRVLEMIAIRYETASRQVQVIETRLGEGRRMLARDNIELRKLYEQVEAQMAPVQKNAYLGELILQELEKQVKLAEDSMKRERLMTVTHDVAMRVQDLRTMEEVFYQFYISIDLTRQNNSRLAQSVERTLSLATNVVIVGLAIQTALARQKRVLEATQKTKEFLGNVIAANASAIKQHTQEIGDIYNNPVIALDKITEAHDQLLEALNMVERMQKEGIDNARQNIARLTELSTDLHERSLASHGSAENSDIEIKPVEA